MKKRVAAMALCVCILFGMMQMALAAADPLSKRVSLTRWQNTSSIALSLSRTNGVVSWGGQIFGYSGTTCITAEYVLDKWNGSTYVFIDSWQDEDNASYLGSSGSVTGTAGTYRLSVTATVTRNGSDEDVTDSLVKTLS